VLFDLRSRRRRGAVKVIYLGLAILIGGGLVLFGVGTGTGGGLLNGLGGSGGGGGHSVVSQQQRSALKLVKANPSSPSAWAALVQADWAAANQAPNLSSSTGVFSTSGRRDLEGVSQAFARYSSLVKHPDPNVSILAARADVILRSWSAAASAWNYVAASEPTAPSAFECLALTAYAAGQTQKGNLAYQKAVSLFPKASKFELAQQLKAAKAQPAAAAAQLCS
jgi:hypothetical protein